MTRILTGLLLCCVLTACTKGGRTPDDTLVVALGAQPSTLDPRAATDANGVRIAALLFTSLVSIGSNLEVVPAAAESWEYKDNTYFFKLRPGLKFTNGRPITKEDIEFSFEQYRQTGSPFASGFEPIESVTVTENGDRIEVAVKMKYFSAKFLRADLSAVRILPKAEALAAGADFGKKLVGSGPYKVVRQDLNEIELEAVDSGPIKTSKVKKMLFKIIRDDYTRFQKTLKGEVDIAQTELPLDKIQEFEKQGDKFKVVRFPGLSVSYILLNLNDPAFQNRSVRLALAQALNREEIIQYKLNGMAVPATSILTPNNPDFNASLKFPEHNLEAARKAIEAAGLKGKTIILKSSNNPQAIDNAKVLANQLSQAGLKVDLQSYEWGTFFDDVRKGNFQMATMKWVASLDPDIYRLAFHSSEKPPGRNRGSYINKALDPLLEQAYKIEDNQKRREIYQKIQQIVLDDMPVIPLWYEQQVSVLKTNIEGYKPSQMGDYLPLLDVTKTAEK